MATGWIDMNASRYKPEWGHWSVAVWDSILGRKVWEEMFPVGPCGPQDGTIGSPEREGFCSRLDEALKRFRMTEGA